MNTLREAALLALGALEGGADSWQLVDPAITALRAALAEPGFDYERGFVDGMSEQAKRSVDKAVNAMADRKPLTKVPPRKLPEDNDE